MVLRKKLPTLLGAAMLVVALAAFGGIASAASDTEPQSVASTASADGAQAQSVKWCKDSPEELALTDNEIKMLELHNDRRSRKDIRELCVDSRLVKAARRHAEDMIEKDYFSHRSKNGDWPDDRMRKQGYNPQRSGENIAMGVGRDGRPSSIFKLWMKSKGHRNNILERRFKDVGIGEAIGRYNKTNDTHMWVVKFGRTA